VRILVVRHGPAGDREEWERTGKDDSLRPLTPKGRKEVRKAAAGLVLLGVAFVAMRRRQLAD